MSLPDDVIDFLARLAPMDPVGVAKTRIGGDADGGYVMLDCIRPAAPVLSYGVGPDITFDLAMAERGHQVTAFDHTVETMPGAHENLRWVREGIGERDTPEKHLATLATHAARHAEAGEDMILKLDVEGAEWHALLAAPDALLARFQQIVGEFHSFESIAHAGGLGLRREVLQKLLRQFALVHVHSNNSQPFFTVHGMPVSNLLELSFVRRDVCRTVPSTALFPTALDRPCNPRLPEHRLWFYPFLPGTARGLCRGG
jgi:hypothetical protein